MTAEGHLFFSIACAVFAKNAELTPVLAQGDWWHIVPSAVLTCLLPDIDHPKSFLGQRLSWISKPVARAFGHRGFTHSLLAVFGALTLFYLKVPDSWIVPADALQGLVLGYLSHILADMLTPAVLIAECTSEMAKFIVAVVSVTQVLYLSEVGGLILGSKLPLNIWELFVIFLERTIISLLIVCPIAHCLF
jgi:membrane-bound metal-dependent hydrolase YbcI (DUF457 family)